MDKRVEFWDGDILVGVREFSTCFFDTVDEAVKDIKKQLEDNGHSVRMVVKDIRPNE